MKRSFLASMALALAVGTLTACSAVSAVSTAASTTATQSQIDAARSTVYGLETVYGTGLIVAVAWAKQPYCGPAAPPAPLCSTPTGIIAIAKAQAAVATALHNAKVVVLAATPQQSDLSLAVSGLQAAYATYQQILTANGVKTSS